VRVESPDPKLGEYRPPPPRKRICQASINPPEKRHPAAATAPPERTHSISIITVNTSNTADIRMVVIGRAAKTSQDLEIGTHHHHHHHQRISRRAWVSQQHPILAPSQGNDSKRAAIRGLVACLGNAL